MRALVFALSLCVASPLVGGCAHINSEKILQTAGEIKSAAERVANFQLAFASALADQGRQDLCIEIAKVGLWALSSIPEKLASIAAELGLPAPGASSPAAEMAEAFCARHVLDPGPETEPAPAPADPIRWIYQ